MGADGNVSVDAVVDAKAHADQAGADLCTFAVEECGIIRVGDDDAVVDDTQMDKIRDNKYTGNICADGVEEVQWVASKEVDGSIQEEQQGRI